LQRQFFLSRWYEWWIRALKSAFQFRELWEHSCRGGNERVIWTLRGHSIQIQTVFFCLNLWKSSFFEECFSWHK
jgi:hypothetical protein